LFSRGNLSSGEREDRSNRWVLAAFALIGVAAGYLPAYTDRIGFWTFDGDIVRWLGVVLFVAGGVLRIWPVFVLGQRFSGLVAIQPGHSLVTSGVYSVIRHPSYLAGVGPRFPVRCRHSAHGAHYSTAPRTHTLGGRITEVAIR